MSDSQQPTFLVSAYSDPVVVRINGKANYLNCNSFREFIEQMLSEERHRFLVDFDNCQGMDSTFLGILAGTALELKKKETPGTLTLCRLSERNQELITNLGLQNLLIISTDEADAEVCSAFDSLDNEEVSDAKNVLKAHENLAAADEQNVAKFQDVISFLKNQVEQDESK
ncbi:anti-sigma factor antagonist [Coraliomargarita sinensis]|uniref:Anti-sigma factor antagonist n=1 Tax=Coraliomargarita sinensis TaxID=2174842 RepID=A0A317ZEE9_9BACT|nr:STAS domain-containing protein [Coraliomargarita sinensis]PXA03706.1 anti-sigma factor antagonist [Coraliomargarita sinensis]